jgi:MFS superfamily sulfate permease-like transporter
MMMGRRELLREFLASIVVFLVALPLCMGVAIASGVPPAMGVISGVIGGLIVGMFSGSPLQISGPAAGLAVIVYELVQEQGIATLGIILIGAGLIQLAAGLLKLGQVFRAITPAVVFGMLAGIGVLIFASQFHVMVDDKPRSTGLQNLISIPEAVYKGLLPMDGSNHHLAAFIGILTIIILVLWTHFKPAALKLVPAPLVAVVVATVVDLWLGLPINNVDVPNTLLDAIHPPTVDTLWKLTEWKIIFEAVALAFVASAETLLSAGAVDRMHTGPRTNFDRELWSQGVGNILCGFAGALPMTGVIVRSSANVQAGAKTRWSAVMHGMWLLVTVAAFPAILKYIPTASLAAILVHTGYKLVNREHMKRLASYGRVPLAIYLVTLTTIVVKDLLTGVIVGVILSFIKILYAFTRLEARLEVEPDGRKAHLYLRGAATFVRLPALSGALEKVPDSCELHLHLDRLTYIDHACLELLSNWEAQHASNGKSLSVEWGELMSRSWGTPEPVVTNAPLEVEGALPGPEPARASAESGGRK